MMRAMRKSAKGFTLIEALAAIAVMVIVLPILLQGFSLAGSLATLTRKTADATALAQSTMDEMLANQNYSNSTTQETRGVTQFDINSTFESWEQEVNVNLLTITVSWDHRGSPHSVTLSTIVYQSASDAQGIGNSPLSGPKF